MVKVLMLHGFGVNAAIFEAQTAPIRKLLPSHWEYHFLQAPLESGPASGIGEIYTGQTYNCWFYTPSLVEFQSVHDFLEKVIEEDGPFDVAWGFSAGAMIIGSLILRHTHEKPHLPPPFRSAIFMNSYMPWSASPNLGIDVTPLVIQHCEVPRTLAEAEHVLALEYAKYPVKEDMLNDERHIDWRKGDMVPPMMKNAYVDVKRQNLDNEAEKEYEDYRAHRFFPEADKVRVPVPSAHILGELDPLKESSLAMCEMCDKRVMLTYKHGFGHEIPTRSPRDLQKIKEVIEKTVIRSDFA